MKNLLGIEKEKTEERMWNSLRQFIDGWYGVEDKDVIFDKSRGWNLNHLALQAIFPSSKSIVMIRDLRGVFSSIEKQYIKNPLFDESNTPIGKTIYHRADHMFGPEGIVGSCVAGIEDMLRRGRMQNILFVFYEELSASPEKTMKKVYEFLGEDYYHHDFDDVKKTAVDPDSFYLNKYPHEGKGKVKPTDVEEWKDYVSEDLANTIMGRFPMYNNFFGYK
jgi:sulfotransferase